VTEQGIQVVTALLGQQEDVFSEDCLFLNVWTKPQVGEQKKAVMVVSEPKEVHSYADCMSFL
jgi:cholinesterase